MAEFALGLTKTAVEGTLVRVKSAIEEEAELKNKVQNDLVFITGEFEMMRSFLYAANTAERAKNPVVGTWVRQLRDLAFDVEDCVDYVVHLDTKESDWWWRVVPSCIAPQLPVDAAVARIQQLKARVEDVSQRNARYNLIGTGDVSTPLNQLIPATTTSSSFDALSEVWEAAGKLRGTGDLKKLITSEGEDLQVVSLWQGSCSTGAAAAAAQHHTHHHLEATYIIKKAYDDPEICQGFKRRAWIKLMHPFDPDEFLKTLLSQFYPPGSSNDQSEALGGAEFRKKMRAAVAEEDDYTKAELMRQVSEERSYLVVIEGVSTVVDWEAIRMYLPDCNNGSRIVVSTEHLRIALLCTREPYQVSQLTRFSDGQFLYAFSKKGSVRRSDLGEFSWQIRRGGVVSVEVPTYNYSGRLCYGGDLIRRMYRCIAQKRKGFEELAFEEHSMVAVPNPFDLTAFADRLFLNFQSSDFRAKEIGEVGMRGVQGVIARCRKYLREAKCLVIIDGLESTEDWDTIKAAFLSGGPAEDTSVSTNSIIVITGQASVAAHCVDAQQNRAFSSKALEDEGVLDRLIKDGTASSSGMEDCPRAQLFYNAYKEEYYWSREFKLVGRENEVAALREKSQSPGVISVWGRSGAGKSVLVRTVVYKQPLTTRAISLVDMPHPFDLKDFFWRLLLDFHSHTSDDDDAQGNKQAVAVGLMKREVDPIQECHRWLREKQCLVVIDDLQSKHDWEEIKSSLLTEPPTQSSSCIIVITRRKSVARHCVDDKEDRLIYVNRLRNGVPPGHSLVKGNGLLVGRAIEMFYFREVNFGVISLWGIGGVGKSSLAMEFYHSRSVGYNQKSWVDVPHPFHLMEFSRRLLLGFHWNDLEAKEIAAVGIMEGQDTIQVCCQFLKKYKCLIVIDGLTSTHDWDLIKAAFFSEPTQCNYIIAITTKESVATHCTSDKCRVHNIKGLDAKDSLNLFTKLAGDLKLLAPEKNLLDAIMAKCGGLPKVISAIAEYMGEQIYKMGQPGSSRPTLTTILCDIHDDFMCKLERDPRFDNLKGLFSWMQSYFDACSDSLKPCIFYLSVFPCDHKRIRRRRLLRRWIAEGYARDTSGGCTAEENAEKLFIELVETSIIQLQQTRINSKEDADVYKVNGFFHEYIISRPMEDNLVFALEGRCSINSQRTGQHLTIRSCWDRDKIVYESIDFTRLRSLTVFGEWRSFFISDATKMGLLRVLDLEDTTSGVTDDVLDQIGKLLPRLKYLSLRRSKEITRIPDSFGGLRQLQTLDVRNTKIVKLPHAIIKLVMLQYIHAGTTHEKMDEVDDTGLPTLDEDDCTSTSSEDSLTSMEGSDGPITGGDNLAKSQPLSATSADGYEPSKRQLAVADHGCTSTNLAEKAHGDNTSTSQPAAADDDGTSTSLPGTADGGGASRNQPAIEDGDSMSISQAEGAPASATFQSVAASIDGEDSSNLTTHGDGTSRSEPATNSTNHPTTAADCKDTRQARATTSSCGVDSTSRTQPPADEDRASTTQAPWRSKARDVAVSYYRSLLSKKKSHGNNRNDGVQIPAAALGKLTALHTLGIVNLSGARGKAVLKELQNLTQLRKLRVSGIDRKKWHDLCSVISGHGHLESFSARLDEDEDAETFFSSSDDMFSDLPKTLKTLKLYTGNGHGDVQVSVGLMKQLGNLSKCRFELRISSQEDIDTFAELPNKKIFRRLCVKPTQDEELCYGRWKTDWDNCEDFGTPVLKIDCGGYNLVIAFGPNTEVFASVLVVHCSSADSSLQLFGLANLWNLREVTLKGYYSEAVKRSLKQQVDEHHNKLVFKWE